MRTHCVCLWGNLRAWASLVLATFSIAWFSPAAEAASIKVTWDPISDPNLSAYNVYYSTVSGYYTGVVSTGKTTEMTLTNLSAGSTYFFVVTYSTQVGYESPWSPETKCVIPVPNSSGGSTTTTTAVKVYTAVPQISAIPSASIQEDTPFWSYPFTISDADTSVDSLLLSLRSSNLDLAPTNRIGITGTGSNRVVTVRPVPNGFGAAYFSLSVTDGKNTNTRSFTLTVNGVNDLPKIAGLPPAIRVDPGTISATYPYTISDVETAVRYLRTWAVSDNQALLPDQNLIVGGTAGSRTINVIAPLEALGIAVVRVAVADDVSTNWTTMEVSLSPSNTPPRLIVNAGAVAIVDTPLIASAIVFDDGLPLRPGKVTLTWSQLSGPTSLGAVTSSTNYSILFNSPGIYTFRCVASDGEYATTQDLLVTVLAQSLAIHPPSSTAPPATIDSLGVYQFRILDVSSDTLIVAWRTTQPALAHLEYSPKSSETWDSLSDGTDPTRNHTAILSGLSPNSDYSLRVRATTPTGLSVTSAPVSIRTLRALISYLPVPLERAEIFGNMRSEFSEGVTRISTGEFGESKAHLLFDVPQTGTYYIWGHVRAGSLSSTPFAVTIDQSTTGIFDSPHAADGTAAGWTRVIRLALFEEPQALGVRLTRGTHSLDLIGLESDATLSHIVITSDAAFVADDTTLIAGIVSAPNLPGGLYLSQLSSGWSLLGNPLQQAGDFASINLYQPEPGTTLQTFNDAFASMAVSVYDGTQWSAQADLQWKQAGAVFNPSENPLVFGLLGSVDNSAEQPELVEGDQLLVLPTPASGTLESLLNIGFGEGDSFTFLDGRAGAYRSCTYDGKAWDSIPVLNVGEAAILTLAPRNR